MLAAFRAAKARRAGPLQIVIPDLPALAKAGDPGSGSGRPLTLSSGASRVSKGARNRLPPPHNRHPGLDPGSSSGRPGGRERSGMDPRLRGGDELGRRLVTPVPSKSSPRNRNINRVSTPSKLKD